MPIQTNHMYGFCLAGYVDGYLTCHCLVAHETIIIISRLEKKKQDKENIWNQRVKIYALKPEKYTDNNIIKRRDSDNMS